MTISCQNAKTNLVKGLRQDGMSWVYKNYRRYLAIYLYPSEESEIGRPLEGRVLDSPPGL